MYNRYIPQQDGSHKRNRVEEPPQPPQNQHRPPPQPAEPAHIPPAATLPSMGNIGSFLRRLIPKDFDTGDLIVVLLLLLMAGDCPDEQNSALLTLALYLFM